MAGERQNKLGAANLIQGHPDPAGGYLCHALAYAYAEGGRNGGHSVSEIAIAKISFPPPRILEEFEYQPLPDSLAEARDAIMAASHIVLIFPLWLGTIPAMVKGFLEQMLRPGIAFEYQEKAFPKKLLTLVYRWFHFPHGLKGLKRNILKFVGINPVRQTLYGMVEAAGPKGVYRWLEQMRALGRKAFDAFSSGCRKVLRGFRGSENDAGERASGADCLP